MEILAFTKFTAETVDSHTYVVPKIFNNFPITELNFILGYVSVRVNSGVKTTSVFEQRNFNLKNY